VIGTPAYMSPEQAEGRLDSLGPATDVYGLGITLYVVLTGRAPFHGDNVNEILDKVRRGEFTRPRSVNPRAPKALEAICMKAMAREQSDRYLNPRALAEDIEHWLADEPVVAYPEPWPDRLGRWVRKHQTFVASAAAVLLMAACAAGLVAAQRSAHARDIEHKNFDLATANRALEAERTKAEERERLAVDAVKRFRDAVIEEPELRNNPGLEGLRKRLLKEPLAFFRSLRERLQADRDTRTESLARLAEASFALAYLTNEIGDKQVALAAYAESLAIRERLANASPSVGELQRDLALSHNNMGVLLRETGKPADAVKSHEAALAIWKKLADANLSASELQSELAGAHYNIGNLLREIGKPADALKSSKAALLIRAKLADANPSVTQFQSDLAASHNNIGTLLQNTGKPADALKSFQAALAIQTKLANANPSVAQFQSELETIHNNIGILLKVTGRPAEALRSFQAAVAIQRKLADANPSVSAYQRDLAGSQNNIGNLLKETGKPADALKCYREALDIQAKLVAGNATVSEFRRNLAMSHNNIGVLLFETGKPTEALKSFEAALEIRTKVADASPSVSEYQSELAGSHHSLGFLLMKSGKLADALKSYQSALAIKQKLVRERPESPDFASELGSTLNDLALIDINARRFVAARHGLREAVECQRRAMASYPAHPIFRQHMANHLASLIHTTRALGDAKALAQAERQLLELRETDPAMAVFDARLKAIVKGEQRPKDVGERLQFAQRAYDLARLAAAARFWREAIELDPRLGDDRQAEHRYNAACAAALAGCFQTNDDPRPSDDQKTKLRQQALDWLNAELGASAKLLATASNEERAGIGKTLERWREDTDLRGIRDDAGLAKLPETERTAFRKLWAEVDALLRKASVP
jgi:tetratricopeptide (TPR) repeat protein